MRPGERTGKFRVGPGIVIRDVEDKSEISMEDLAVAMIDEIENPHYIRARFTAAY
jgi:putative NADH-flavin reductase